ncbi:MAG: glycosyltransferase family 9 protein, partial [Candidatus Tectomicrobia bacterium]|nr:glycosyltransferase family 9 protein [Candidatus Tectomicrobia bacterium]
FNHLKQILVIRAGAVGDSVLLLPVLSALRVTCPESRIEVMGYRERLWFAEHPAYANRVVAFDQPEMGKFFLVNSHLPDDLVCYFRRFDLIISYLHDRDGCFRENMKRIGIPHHFHYLPFPKEGEEVHIVNFLLAPLKALGIVPRTTVPKIFLSEDDRRFACDYLSDLENSLAIYLRSKMSRCKVEQGVAPVGTYCHTPLDEGHPLIALHPGGGSPKKWWDVEKFAILRHTLQEEYGASILILSGPADIAIAEKLLSIVGSGPTRTFARDRYSVGAYCHTPLRIESNPKVTLVRDRSLREMAAILACCDLFVGNDSGFAHMAAALGVPSVVIFGPTDPDVWRPLGDHVDVVKGKDLESIEANEVLEKIRRKKWALKEKSGLSSMLTISAHGVTMQP